METQLWLSHFTRVVPMPELVEPVRRPYRWNKPPGGMWTSTLTHPANWFANCRKRELALDPRPHFWSLDVAPTAKIFEVDTADHLANLAERWPDHEAPDPDPIGSCGVDWEGVATVFDGVHLTGPGVERLAEGDVVWEGERNLCGWDCESTLWFRWVFENVTELPNAEGLPGALP